MEGREGEYMEGEERGGRIGDRGEEEKGRGGRN